MNPKLALQLTKNMGLRYVRYRAKHEWQKRRGILEKKHPIHPQKRTIIYLHEWLKNTPEFLFKDRTSLHLPALDDETLAQLKSDAEHILSGKIKYFNHTWKDLGLNYDWLTNPNSGYRYANDVHWSKIQDFNPKNGDIKYVWEKSRFSYILTILRYDYYFNEDHSKFVFNEIASWIEANPINLGLNWKCSQEISLRCFNWLFALYFYKNSPHLNENLFQSILQVFKWSLHHVFHHIDFSRIAVRNNHAITETLFLALSNMLFPFIPQTKKYAAYGRKYFEQEIAYQIYEDGTFLQFSMNYHRVVIQLLSLGIKLSEIHQQPFSEIVYDRAYKSLNFLYQCMQTENGNLPNYGANDGALFFPLSQTDYRDFRPQLNALHKILTQEDLFEIEEVAEEMYWFNQSTTVSKRFETLTQKQGAFSFLKGGYYLIRDEDTLTFIRCGNHKDRPSQADNLHIDIWYKGQNIMRDGGSFEYNTDAKWVNYFMGTASHNTVMAAEDSQMLKGGRFIWYYWTQATKSVLEETDDAYIFAGEISAFRHLNKNATHHRTIRKIKGKLEWYIEDKVYKLEHLEKVQIWHPNHPDLEIVSNGVRQEVEGYFSSYYGSKTACPQINFTFATDISTTLKIEG